MNDSLNSGSLLSSKQTFLRWWYPGRTPTIIDASWLADFTDIKPEMKLLLLNSKEFLTSYAKQTAFSPFWMKYWVRDFPRELLPEPGTPETNTNFVFVDWLVSFPSCLAYFFINAALNSLKFMNSFPFRRLNEEIISNSVNSVNSSSNSSI